MYCGDTSCLWEPATPSASLSTGSVTNEVTTVVGAVASGNLVSVATGMKASVMVTATARNPALCKKRSDVGDV